MKTSYGKVGWYGRNSHYSCRIFHKRHIIPSQGTKNSSSVWKGKLMKVSWHKTWRENNGEQRMETTFNASNLFHSTTFALKQITRSLFDIVSITQLLIWLSCFWFIHLLCCSFVRRPVLLIRQTMSKALLNAFTWFWARTPSPPTAPSWIRNDLESENGVFKGKFARLYGVLESVLMF